MLEVLEVSGMASIQDRGRLNWRRYGVPTSGPMDAFAFQAANLLVGNPPEAAALELGSGDLALCAARECVIAGAGAGFNLSVQDRQVPLWDSCFVRRNWIIRLKWSGTGVWAYLAVSGGFDVPPVLGSRSTYLRGRFGGLEGRLLQAGDVIPTGPPERDLSQLAARTLNEAARPPYTERPQIEVILGPQAGRFTAESLEAFWSEPYRVSLTSDRMGYRLEGKPLVHLSQADLTSEGLTAGTLQVPADGQPLVVMADSPTVGGYPKIASVAGVDLPLLAQCTPGSAQIRFRQTSVEAARQRYHDLIQALNNGIVESGSGGW